MRLKLMHFRLSELATATRGQLVGVDDPHRLVDGVCIDSREVDEDALFVPIVAERNGHDYIDAAFAAGAGATIADRSWALQPGQPTVVVEDTAAALTEIGKLARSKMSGTVVGITGSVGKTSVKDLAAAAIGAGAICHASRASFNNELGVPLTLANAPDNVEVTICEMGSRGIGHIASLAELVQPRVGIVTWVGAAHTSEFGSVETVAKAKGELVEALPSGGTAILNSGNDWVRSMQPNAGVESITYGENGDFAGTDIKLDRLLRPSFVAQTPVGSVPVSLAVRGRHQVDNALAALAAAFACGIPLEVAAEGLSMAEISPSRMQLIERSDGALILNDAYNANTVSMEAGLRALAELDVDRRVAVLGTMAELGERHDDDHLKIAQLCSDLDIELVAFREHAYRREVATDFDEARQMIGPVGDGVAVLVKGSLVSGLQPFARSLASEI